MKQLAPAASLLALFALGGASAAAQEFPGNPSFRVTETPTVKALSGLVGCWVGKNPWGVPSRATYELSSDATVIMERLEQQGQPTMFSAIYVDGETAVMHHFCSYGSQIRFRAEPGASPDVVHFAFQDATNIKSREQDDYMTDVTFMFKGRDQLVVDWGLHQNRKDLRQLFPFTRVVEGCDIGKQSDVWR